MELRITAGSFSRMAVYKECPKRTKIQYIDKIPPLERPAPPKGKEHANDRGSRIHDAAELYVKGEGPFVTEMLNFEEQFKALKLAYEQQTEQQPVYTEQLWTFDDVWEPTDPEVGPIWLRVILDALEFTSSTSANVIDYKTGKRVNNQVKHAQQGQLYMLAAFLRYPQLEEIEVQFWYLDQSETYRMTYTREQGLRFLSYWNKKMLEMTSDYEFKASPSKWTCRFCPYQTGKNKWITGTGDCNLNP